MAYLRGDAKKPFGEAGAPTMAQGDEPKGEPKYMSEFQESANTNTTGTPVGLDCSEALICWAYRCFALGALRLAHWLVRMRRRIDLPVRSEALPPVRSRRYAAPSDDRSLPIQPNGVSRWCSCWLILKFAHILRFSFWLIALCHGWEHPLRQMVSSRPLSSKPCRINRLWMGRVEKRGSLISTSTSKDYAVS